MLRVIPVVLVALLLISACDDGDDAPAEPTAPTDATAAATALATPDPSHVNELIFLEPIELPEDIALTIETGCWQCDGPTTGFVRLRRVADGSLEERTLLDPAAYDGVVNGSAWDIAPGAATVAICAGSCRDQIGEARVAILQSRDGGVTWTAGPTFEDWRWIEGASQRKAILSGQRDSPDVPPPAYDVDGTVIAPPADGVNPHPLPNEILWDSNGRSTLRDAANNVLSTSVGDEIASVHALNASGERLGVLIFRQGDEAGVPSGYRLNIGRRTETGLQFEVSFAVDNGFILPGPPLDECRFFANVDVPAEYRPTPDTDGAAYTGFLPAIVNWCEGTAQPILDPFTREPYLNGRNYVLQVQEGPFVAVTPEVGDCLNVRLEPDPTSTVIDCFAAGVLLRDLNESRLGDGQTVQTWRRVATPAGDEGWASGEFLAP